MYFKIVTKYYILDNKRKSICTGGSRYEENIISASESVPFIKTGGLADVVGSLPKWFVKKEYDVRVIIPKYMCIDEKWKSKMQYVDHFYMDLCWRRQYVGILQMELDGVTYYFIDNEYYFSGPKPYGDVRYDLRKICIFLKSSIVSTSCYWI